MSQFDRVFDILEHLGACGATGVGELCAKLDLPRPSCHRLLAALERRGYVEHDVAGRVYRLGIAAQLLARHSATASLIGLAEPVLVDLRDSTGETINLAALSGTRIIYCATLDGVLLPRMSARIGEAAAPHATALGKAIVARLPPSERSILLGRFPLRRFTAKTITDEKTLTRELEHVLASGYALDDEESVVGAFCIGAPIIDGEGRPLGALSLSGIAARIGGSRSRELGQMLVDACRPLSLALCSAGAEPTSVHNEPGRRGVVGRSTTGKVMGQGSR